LLQIVITSSSGTDTIELADKELYVVSTNDTQRQLATAKYREQLEAFSIGSATIRSKSKSPRRSKTGQAVEDDSNLPSLDETSSLPKSTTIHNGGMCGKSRSQMTSSASPPAQGGKHNRRPHTSAGPRDRPVDFAGTAYGRNEAGTSGTRSGHLASGTTQSKRHSETIIRNALNRPEIVERFAPMNRNGNTKKTGTGGNDNISNKTSSSKCNVLTSPSALDLLNFFRNNSTAPSSCSASSSGHSSSFGDGDSLSQSSDGLREWEEELARIEARSKESSVLFASTKKREKSFDPSNIVHSSVGVDSSEEYLPVQRV